MLGHSGFLRFRFSVLWLWDLVRRVLGFRVFRAFILGFWLALSGAQELA